MLKDIIKDFNKLKKISPNLGSYIILCYTLIHKKYNNLIVKKSFNRLVKKDEYDIKEKKEYIDYLIKLTNRTK